MHISTLNTWFQHTRAACSDNIHSLSSTFIYHLFYINNKNKCPFIQDSLQELNNNATINVLTLCSILCREESLSSIKISKQMKKNSLLLYWNYTINLDLWKIINILNLNLQILSINSSKLCKFTRKIHNLIKIKLLSMDLDCLQLMNTSQIASTIQKKKKVQPKENNLYGCQKNKIW